MSGFVDQSLPMALISILVIGAFVYFSGLAVCLTLDRTTVSGRVTHWTLGTIIICYGIMGALHAGLFQYVIVYVYGAFAGAIFLISYSGRLPSLRGHQGACLVFGFILLAAVIVRWPVSNFIFLIGDSGAYINSANSLARSGKSVSEFYPLYQAVLGLWSALFGKACTPYGNLMIGVGAVYGFYLLAGRLFGKEWIGVMAALVFVFNIMPMWFSRIPLSENLMMMLNLFLLYWISKFETEEDISERLKTGLICGLLVGLVSLTRVTGIVWMIIITVYYFYEMLFKSGNRRPVLVLYVSSFLFYGYSVVFALSKCKVYYLEMQITTYMPAINTPGRVIALHLVWALGGLITGLGLAWLGKRMRAVTEFICRHSVLFSAILLPVIVAVPLIIFRRWGIDNFLSLFSAFLDSEQLGQEEYYLVNYFSLASYVLMPLGLAILIWKRNPLRQKGTLSLFLFGTLFLAVSYLRSAFANDHDLYLYWDRYIYSDVFIFYMVIFVAGLQFLLQLPWIKWAGIALLAVYFQQSFVWAGILRGESYMQGGFEAVDRIAKRISPNSVVLFENRYHGPWLFQNARHCFLTPLNVSYGLNIDMDHAPFTQDAPLNPETIAKFLSSFKNVYVVTMTGSLPQPLEIKRDMPNVKSVTEDVFTCETAFRRHRYKNIFHLERETARYVLTLERYNRSSIRPRDYSVSGFYADGVWTKDRAVIKDVNHPIPDGVSTLVMHVHGWRPPETLPDRGEVVVHVNGRAIPFVGYENKSFRYRLPQDLKKIDSIQIMVPTFLPNQKGFYRDSRVLGIDIEAFTLE